MLQFRSSSQSLPSERDRDGDILLLSQGSVNGKQVQSGKGKEKARLTSSPLEDIGVSLITLVELVWIADHRTEDRLWVDIYEPTTEVCHPQYSVFAAP